MDYTYKVVDDGGNAISGAVVTVCTSGASLANLPCTPKASIYTDSTLGTPKANPFVADQYGNVAFSALPGTYVVSITGAFSPGYSFKMAGSGAFAGSIAGTQVAFGSATNTIAGSANFTWDNTNKSLTVSNTGLNGVATLYGLAAGVITNDAGIVAQCQQLANFFCQAGQFSASDSGAGPIGSIVGIAPSVSHLAAGTLSSFIGVDVNQIVGVGTGAITTSRGIHVGGVSFPTGTTPTTQDGIKIDDQCAGSFSAPTCIGLNVAAQSNSGIGVQSPSLKTSTDCAVNSVSPAACAAACSGAFVVPTTTTTYTVNTTCPTSNTSHIFLFPRTDNSGLPSAPTCVAVAVTSSVDRSAHVNNTSFTFILPSTTGTTCFDYFIVSN